MAPWRRFVSRLIAGARRGRATRGAGEEAPARPDAESRRLAAAAVETKLSYRFRDPCLLGQALVHRSHLHAYGDERIEANERLEFLGDAVLGLVTNAYLYLEYTDLEEGALTRLKSKLVCGASLARVAQRLELGDHILMSRGEAATGGRDRDSILADAVEAIIGAVYLDGGLEAAQGVIERWLFDHADEILDHRGLANDKSRLQEIVQARHRVPPRYRVLETTGPDHERVFTVEVLLGERVLGHGRGANKKSAEQEAAGCALQRLAGEPSLLDDPPASKS
ncbi:MAG: ribonuclease III [bacterium]|nr:ribonuclease III [bacterium]